MKSEDSAPTRFYKDGLLIYSSGTLHHQEYKVSGYLYKKASTSKIFQKSTYYKRYFVISPQYDFVAISDRVVSRGFTKLPLHDITSIRNIKEYHASPTAPNGQRWSHTFELVTKDRVFLLYARTKEERDLWVSGFTRLLSVPIKDKFEPLGFGSRNVNNNEDDEALANDHAIFKTVEW